MLVTIYPGANRDDVLRTLRDIASKVHDAGNAHGPAHDLTSGQDLAELHGHSGRVLMAGFTTDPDVLVSAAADGTIRSWSLAGQKQLAEIRVDASLQSAALDARTGTVIAPSATGTIAVRIPSPVGRE